MNIKKNPVAGLCLVVRCAAAAVDKLCAKHQAEWEAAGRPELTATAAPKKGDALAVTGALSPEETTALVLERDNTARAIEFANQIPVKTPEDRERAIRIKNQAQARAKEIDAQRKARVKPLNDTVKWINGAFNDVGEAYETVARVIDKRVSAELLALETARREALKVIEAGAGVAPPEAFLAAHADTSPPEAAGAARVSYDYRMTDAAAVPEAYWTRVLDHEKIRHEIATAALQAREPSIPGLVFTKTLTLAKGAA